MRPTDLLTSLEWEIDEAPIFDQRGAVIAGHKALQHGRTGDTLAVVSSQYRPVRNEELLNYVQQLSENTNLELQGFSEFRGGRRVMAFMAEPQPQSVARYAARNFMVIGNSHDKSTAFFTGFVSHIVRCENQFTVQNQQIRVHHTRGAEDRLADLLQCTEMYYNVRTGMYESMEQMEAVPVRLPQVREAANRILDITDLQEPSHQRQSQRASLERDIRTEMDAFGENALGLFNGVTRYTSHNLRQKHPLFGNPFGRANELNERALNICREMVLTRPRAVPVRAEW